jgi:hypothetical protein
VPDAVTCITKVLILLLDRRDVEPNNPLSLNQPVTKAPPAPSGAMVLPEPADWTAHAGAWTAVVAGGSNRSGGGGSGGKGGCTNMNGTIRNVEHTTVWEAWEPRERWLQQVNTVLYSTVYGVFLFPERKRVSSL